MKETVAQRANECGVLLVRVDDVPEVDSRGSTLSKRQKQWLNSAPNDCTTQNPVVYKYVHTFEPIHLELLLILLRYTKEISKPVEDLVENEEASSTVQNLLDQVAAPPPSGIASRIKDRRRERYVLSDSL